MSFQLQIPSARSALTRRQWLQWSTAGVIAGSISPWFKALADEAGPKPPRGRSCILLWMSGGPSQMDTFDLKPGHANGGPFKEIETSGAGHEHQRAPAEAWPSTASDWPSSAR